LTGWSRVVIVVLDSAGVGAAPDACRYGDSSANTLRHVAEAVGGLQLPTLESLGLGGCGFIPGLRPPTALRLRGSFGLLTPRSAGKDTISGHWELAGVITERPFPVYPDGFPPEVIAEFCRRAGVGVLGNRPASGTQIIEELGPEHLRTGKVIVYTSADSVFQIAAHEDIIPPAQLYRLCEIARDVLRGPHAVARVIARPFVGSPGGFRRTAGRRDYALPPPRPTLLDACAERGLPVVTVGKVGDIFARSGVTEEVKTTSDRESAARLSSILAEEGRGLVFANLVELDMLYGHRNNPEGYAAHLERIDGWVSDWLSRAGEGDLLLLTADHGCDPTTPGTDHTREYVPVLAYSCRAALGVDLGLRPTLADVAATAADALALGWQGAGTSFLPRLRRPRWP